MHPGPLASLERRLLVLVLQMKFPPWSTEAGEGSYRASLSGFSATDICSYLVNNDVYIGDGLQEVKDWSCNRKMGFIFDCHSLTSFFYILGHSLYSYMLPNLCGSLFR